MNKTVAMAMVIVIAFALVISCFAGIFKDESTTPTEPDPTITTQTETEPEQEEPAETEENVTKPEETEPIDDPQDIPETTQPTVPEEATFLSITPTHSVCKNFTFSSKLPSNDTSSDWWKTHQYGSPTESFSGVDIHDIESFDELLDSYLNTWEEFSQSQVADLVVLANTKAVTVHDLDAEGMYVFLEMESASVINIKNGLEMTVEDAIRSGCWSYQSVTLDEDLNMDLFGVKEIKMASQIVDVCGTPSEIYYYEAVSGVYAYFLEYDLGGYSVLFGGAEVEADAYDDETALPAVSGVCVYGDGMEEYKNELLDMFTKIE